MTIVTPDRHDLHWDYRTTDKYGKEGILSATLHRRKQTSEQMQTLRVDALAAELQDQLEGGYTEGPAEDEFMGRLRQLTDTAAQKKAADTDQLLDNMLKKADEQVGEYRPAPDPVTFFTIITLGPGRPPKVTRDDGADKTVVRVGDCRIWFDGTKVVVE
jgi:hypothetical protein